MAQISHKSRSEFFLNLSYNSMAQIDYMDINHCHARYQSPNLFYGHGSKLVRFSIVLFSTVYLQRADIFTVVKIDTSKLVLICMK